MRLLIKHVCLINERTEESVEKRLLMHRVGVVGIKDIDIQHIL